MKPEQLVPQAVKVPQARRVKSELLVLLVLQALKDSKGRWACRGYRVKPVLLVLRALKDSKGRWVCRGYRVKPVPQALKVPKVQRELRVQPELLVAQALLVRRAPKDSKDR